jgi:hypothetical protein
VVDHRPNLVPGRGFRRSLISPHPFLFEYDRSPDDFQTHWLHQSPLTAAAVGGAPPTTPLFPELQTVCPAAMTHRWRGSHWTSNGCLSSSYSALPHTGRTRSRASPSSRTRTRAGHVTIRPGYRLYTMGPAHAHASGSHLSPPAKLNHVPSAPHAVSPASPAPLAGTLSSHAITTCAHY